MLKVMKMLVSGEYKRVGILTPKAHSEFRNITHMLYVDTETSWKAYPTNRYLTIGDTRFEFFDVAEPERLRGLQFDAVIMQGTSEYPQTEQLMRYGLRLGETPILIKM